jgi:hypothetical protein
MRDARDYNRDAGPRKCVLERLPYTWNQVIEKESLNINKVEHVGIEKVEQLFRDMLKRAAGLLLDKRDFPDLRQTDGPVHQTVTVKRRLRNTLQSSFHIGSGSGSRALERMTS